MTGRSHLLFGATASLATTFFTGEFHLTYLLAGALGGLMPDLDASESMIKHLKVSIDVGVKIEPFKLLATITAKCFRHRGVIHSLAGCAIIVGAIAMGLNIYGWLDLTTPYLIAFTLGYLSHLVGDGLTVSGVPYFYPLSQSSYHAIPRLLTFTTGTFPELIVSTAVLVVLGLGLAWLHSHALLRLW